MSEKNIYLKLHARDRERVLALCDREQLGKRLAEGDTVIDLARYRSFYEGELADDSSVASALTRATSVNLVGKRALSAAVKAGLAHATDARTISGVPHLQIFRIE